MVQAIKENLDIILALVIGLGLTAAGITGLLDTIPINRVLADTATETISITATVEASISLMVSTSSVHLSPSLVDINGVPNIGSSTNITLTAGTNDSGGYSINIGDPGPSGNSGALCHSGGCATGALYSADAVLVAGTDGYGVQATTTDSDVTVDSDFNYWGNEHVGNVTSTLDLMASTGGPTFGDQILIKIKAAAATSTQTGTYDDQLQLTCVSST
jgi:hypothetical protein